ncbi:hypothetical protein GCM10027035_24780 [Emticicia sediminis]
MMTKETLFTNWHFMRWLRLGMGLYAAVVALQLRDPLSGLIAALFLFQAVTNTGCCGANGCSVPTSSKRNSRKIEEVEFEEIKN